MKNWKCPNCSRHHQTKDDVVTCFCNCCGSELEEYPIKKKEDKKFL